MMSNNEHKSLEIHSKDIHFKVTYWKALGFFPVGSAKPITKTGYKLFFKHIVFVVFACALFEWQPLHKLLTPKISNLTSKMGLALIFVAGFFFYRMLKKHSNFERKYYYSPPEWRD